MPKVLLQGSFFFTECYHPKSLYRVINRRDGALLDRLEFYRILYILILMVGIKNKKFVFMNQGQRYWVCWEINKIAYYCYLSLFKLIPKFWYFQYRSSIPSPSTEVFSFLKIQLYWKFHAWYWVFPFLFRRKLEEFCMPPNGMSKYKFRNTHAERLYPKFLELTVG